MQRGGADGSARWVQRGTGRTVDRCVEAVCAPGSPGALNRVCLAVTLSRGLSYLVSVSVYVRAPRMGRFSSIYALVPLRPHLPRSGGIKCARKACQPRAVG
jgi:hypothetical protein